MLKLAAPIALMFLATSCASPQESAEADICHAGNFKSLIGKPRGEIPMAPPGATWRVTCTTCPMTMDYSPARLNILFDEASDIVKEVRCG